MLWSDTLSDPNTGSLSKSSSDPANCQQGYVGGEYQIAKVSPSFAGNCGVTVPGSYADITVSVDFHLNAQASSNPGQFINVDCQHQTVVVNGKSTFPDYVANFTPATGQVALFRTDPGATVTLSAAQYTTGAPMIAAEHHAVLACAGSTITLSVDGKQVASVQDSTYASGNVQLVTGVFANFLPNTIDARFSDLVLTQP